MNSELQQLMAERMQMLEDALQKAETGVANGGDWDIIRSECGVSKRQIVNLKTLSIRSKSWD